MSIPIDNEELDIHTQFSNVTQLMYETWVDALNRLNGGIEKDVSVIKNRGNTVRAAVESGLMNSYTIEDIDNWEPYKSRWLAPKIAEHFAKADEIPLPSSSEQPMQPREKETPQES